MKNLRPYELQFLIREEQQFRTVKQEKWKKRLAIADDAYCAIARRKYIPSTWWHPAAWAMMIELYRARLMRERSTVKTLQIASGVAQATAIRQIDILEAENWLKRRRNSKDARVVNVRMTDPALEILDRWADKRLKELQALSEVVG